uniref:Uncharacterized protein n=1 Tax=viral metagenome TaxID=1070528 RepID=A0A6M3KBM7_9ZZZZ
MIRTKKGGRTPKANVKVEDKGEREAIHISLKYDKDTAKYHMAKLTETDVVNLADIIVSIPPPGKGTPSVYATKTCENLPKRIILDIDWSMD